MKNRSSHCILAVILTFLIATGIVWSQERQRHGVRQVRIETRFVEVSDDQLGELGVDWDSLKPAGPFGFIFGERPKVRIDRRAPGTSTATDGTSPTSGIGMIDPSVLNSNPGHPAPFSSSGRRAVILDDAEVQSVVRALEREGRSITSAPSVTIFDGEVATISDFYQRPFAVALVPVGGAGSVGFQPFFSPGESIVEIGGGAALGNLSEGPMMYENVAQPNPNQNQNLQKRFGKLQRQFENQNQNQQFQFQKLQNQNQRLQKLDNRIQNQNQQTNVTQVGVGDSNGLMNDNASDLTLGWTYFLNNNVGVGTQFEWLSGDINDAFMGQAEVTYRFPIEFEEMAAAPYGKVGVGGFSGGEIDEFVASLAAGVEFRNSSDFGIYAEYANNFLSNGEDFSQVLLGIRFVPNVKGGQRRGQAPRHAGVSLHVTPTVLDGETIELNLAPEVVEFEGFQNYGSPIQTSGDAPPEQSSGGGQVSNPLRLGDGFGRVFPPKKSKVLVADGQTAVVGGVITEVDPDGEPGNTGKVPFLGDIPVVGRLFRSRVDEHIKRNLIIFVTAELIDPAGSR